MKVGILGTGKIGTDLLLKIHQSHHLECVLFSGRNEHSEGIQKAKELGALTSTKSIDAFKEDKLNIDLAFDATSAAYHREHAAVFESLNIKAIDLTPARMGPLCVPLINDHVIFNHNNVNMVTCGGQSSIPIIESLAKALPTARSVTLKSIVAPDSIGQSTLDNIDDYYSTTSGAISEFTGIPCTDISLDIMDNDDCKEMLNIIRVNMADEAIDHDALMNALQERVAEINKYVPGYRLIDEPQYSDSSVEIKIAVRGQGLWIPEHAGNLDIINCAALSIAEKYAMHMRAQNTQSFSDKIKSMLRGKKTAYDVEAKTA